jgi:hypothetical protein
MVADSGLQADDVAETQEARLHFHPAGVTVSSIHIAFWHVINPCDGRRLSAVIMLEKEKVKRCEKDVKSSERISEKRCLSGVKR